MTFYVGGVAGAAASVAANEASAASGTVAALALVSSAPILLVRLTESGNVDLQGMANGSANRIVILMYVGAGVMTITSEDAGATEAHRFVLPGGNAQGFYAGSLGFFIYDPTASRWKMCGRSS